MIIVFGSITIDMYIPVDTMPAPGSHTRCEDYTSYPGGKGANQAFAAARAGAKTALIGRIGDDAFGRRSTYNLKQQSILGSGIGRSERPTGAAFILPGTGEEKTIIASPGANFDCTHDQIPDSILKPENTVIGQLLIPLKETLRLFERAKKGGAHTILNASPPQFITLDILKLTDTLVINAAEVSIIADKLGIDGGKTPEETTKALNKAYNVNIITTLGSKGIMAIIDGTQYDVEPFSVNIEDTTGAGDCFLGYYAALRDKGMSAEDALKRACIAGSIACQAEGAQSSVPFIEDIEAVMDRAPNVSSS